MKAYAFGHSQWCYPHSVTTCIAAFHTIPSINGWETWIARPVFLHAILEFDSHDGVNLWRKISQNGCVRTEWQTFRFVVSRQVHVQEEKIYFFADKLRKCGPKQGLRAIITYALDLCLKNFKSALRISYSPIMIASNAIIYNFLRGSSTRCSCYNASSRYTHNYPFKFSGLMRVIRVTKFLHTISTW